MKKFSLIPLVLLLVAAFFFFTLPRRVPLHIRLTGMTNQEDGGVNIYFTVSNQTARSYCFFTYPQALSNGLWFTSVDDRATFGGTRGLHGKATSEQVVHTYRNAGTMRLQVTVWSPEKPWPNWFSAFLRRIRLQQYFNDKLRRELDSTPFDLPPR